MRKHLQLVFSFVMVVLFTVSFTGIRLFVHECASCNTVAVGLLKPLHDCCEKPSGTNHSQCAEVKHAEISEPISCCNADSEPQTCHKGNCCSDEIRYIVNETDFTKERPISNPEPLVLPVLLACFTDISLSELSASQISYPLHSNDPPPRLTGKEWIIYSHQLKIS